MMANVKLAIRGYGFFNGWCHSKCLIQLLILYANYFPYFLHNVHPGMHIWKKFTWIIHAWWSFSYYALQLTVWKISKKNSQFNFCVYKTNFKHLNTSQWNIFVNMSRSSIVCIYIIQFKSVTKWSQKFCQSPIIANNGQIIRYRCLTKKVLKPS